MVRKICHLATSGRVSHNAWGETPLGADANGSHGNLMSFAWTMYPTKPAIATRPCLISASRRKPMVASLESPQNSPPDRLSGSQKPTTGLSDLALALRPSRSIMDTPAVRDCMAGATPEKARDEDERA